MEFYISFFVQNLILDISIILLTKKVMNLKLSNLEIVVLLLFSVMPQALWIAFKYDYVWFVLSKIAFYLFFSIFSANKFRFREVVSLFIASVALLFSVFGFAEFFDLFIQAVCSELFNFSLPVLFHILVTAALCGYIMLLKLVLVNLPKRKKLKNLIQKVSFFLFGRHIEITGLIDTGNTLIDTKTQKPVIVISLSVLEKFLSENEIQMLASKNYYGLNISGSLKYKSVAGDGEMPIVDIGKVKIIRGKEEFYYNSVLGIVSEDLTTEKYDCLLGRDFL